MLVENLYIFGNKKHLCIQLTDIYFYDIMLLTLLCIAYFCAGELDTQKMHGQKKRSYEETL